MKIKVVYKLFALAVLFVVFQSRSAGPGTVMNAEVTGAPGSVGSQGTCANAGCHSTGAFNPALSIELLDGGGEVVDKYDPGVSYTLRIVNTPGDGTPAGYGFQAVALDATDSQAGGWGALGAGQQVVPLSNRDYVEHSTPSDEGTFETEWIAPNAGTGSVTFYSASAAVNANGTSGGDGTAAGSLEIAENDVSSVFDLQRDHTSLEVMPNPVGEMLNLQVTSLSAGNFQLRVIDVAGSIVQTETVNLTSGVNRREVNVGNLPAGLYVVQLCGDSHVAATQMLKK